MSRNKGYALFLLWSFLTLPIFASIGSTKQIHLEAIERYGRIDLLWHEKDLIDQRYPKLEPLFFEIQRKDTNNSHFKRINQKLWTTNLYGDFIAKTKGQYAYRVRAVLVSGDGRQKRFSQWSKVVSASPAKRSKEQFLDEIQEASFRYFYNWRHPVSGLAREKTPPRQVESIEEIKTSHIRFVKHFKELCAIGASGMGMFNLVVGVERGFISREEGRNWALQMLNFLETKAERFHGAFSHWINGTTGKVQRFSLKDDGADTVETAFLASGLVLLREYFDRDNQKEKQIKQLTDSIWKEINWQWFTRGDNNGPIYWHWSKKYNWEMNHSVHGFNESAILYILAMASPTYPINDNVYNSQWKRKGYGFDRKHFGIKMSLGRGMGPPLFFTHYSYLGLDPRQVEYNGKSYHEHFKDFCLIQIKYAESKKSVYNNSGKIWGLTSSMNPKGYKAHKPGPMDDGTIDPTAGLSSITYVPNQVIDLLKTLYFKHGKNIWKDYGFTDAFNLSENWVANSLLGIDAGPIAPMIENYRTELCWKIFMKAPEIKAVLNKLN